MMKIKRLFDALKRCIFVRKCVSCEELLPYDYDGYLCRECCDKWEEEKKTKCKQCKKAHNECRCDFNNPYVDSVRHLVPYSYVTHEEVAARVVFSMKKVKSNAVFDFAAREIVNDLMSDINFKNYIIVNVPRSPKSIKRYGYDHAKMLAKRISELTGIEYVDALCQKRSRIEQKNLDKDERTVNARKNCYIKPQSIPLIKGHKVILIDDIVTTGAMSGICAELLKKNGARRVDCILCAKTVLKHQN